MQNRLSGQPRSISTDQRMNWPTIIALVLFHFGAIAALFVFNWHAAIAAIFLYWMATGLGISMGYHRLLTHRSYKVPLALEYFFAVCGALTLEGGPIFWVGTHRIHHQSSDRPGDPHSPRDGAWWAHVGWLLFGDAQHNNTLLMSKYAPDLGKNRFYVWLNNYHWAPIVLLAGLLFAIGGVPMVLWGICVRVVVGLEFDLSWLQIRLLKLFGLAKSVKVASPNSNLTKREAA